MAGWEDVLLGRRVGRRLFLGLLGAGGAGLALTRWADVRDDASEATVAAAVPVDTAFSDNPEGFRYYSVASIPAFTERNWRLDVNGVGLDGSLKLRLDDLRAFPNVAIRATFRCVTGWRVRDCVWRGVRVRDVIGAAGPNRNARHITFHSGDGVYSDSLTLEQASSDHALLAWELNGRPLIREQGYPLRLIYPDMYGYKNVKWLRRLEVKPTHEPGFWEQLGWDEEAYVYKPPRPAP